MYAGVWGQCHQVGLAAPAGSGAEPPLGLWKRSPQKLLKPKNALDAYRKAFSLVMLNVKSVQQPPLCQYFRDAD